MIITKHFRSPTYNFFGNTETGLTLRWGTTPDDDPLRAPWPELADISISNHCTMGCDFCYRSSGDNGSFMGLKEYEYVLDSLTSPVYGSVFQVALGGGEPLEHPCFIDMVEAAVQRGIAVNFTTNGTLIDRNIAALLVNKIGAVALSVNRMSDFVKEKAVLLTEAGIKVNVHFVLDGESVEDARFILEGKYNDVLEGVNAVVFLTYKPKGRATEDRCLRMGDEKFMHFIRLINNGRCIARIGFDACFVPLLLRHTSVDVEYVDSCECGFFSVYVDENMNAAPCSFANDDRFRFSLATHGMEWIWEDGFEAYRQEMSGRKCSATHCTNAAQCRGRCRYYEQLSFCYRSDVEI